MKNRFMAMVVLGASAGLMACPGPPEEEPEEPLAPDQVARTYAPELGVDLEEMVRMPGGLYYDDILPGVGEVAEPGRTVVVHYAGWLPDGTQFDSSHDRDEPFQFRLGAGRVIQGWDVGVAGMMEEGVRKLVIPHGMAYGPAGSGPIPPRATLVFDVELLEVR